MDSYYGTLQWYQSSRSSAVLLKTKKEIEIESENYPLHHHNQHRGNSEICGADSKNFSNQTRGTKEEDSVDNLCEPKNVHESIDQMMTEIRMMIADMTSKQSNYTDFSSRSVSNQRSTFDRESQHLFDTKSMHNYQVSLQSDNSKLYKKYKLYSADELDNRRDRGLCLWCDEFWYIGHDCCKKKKLYVFELDEELVEGEVFHCDEHLVEDCVPNNPILLGKFMADDNSEKEEMSEVLGENYKVKELELHVFDEMPEKDALEIMIESCVNETIGCKKQNMCILDATLECFDVCMTSKALGLCDVGNGELKAVMVKNLPPRDMVELFDLISTVEAINQSCWIEWPEPPLPPPEPPPGLS